MLDSWATSLVKRPLAQGAKVLNRHGISANHVTLTGFLIGMIAVPLLAIEQYSFALLCIVLNRIADGLDGTLARIQTPTDAGAFLDITLDFIFYSGVVFGFAMANPVQNGLAATGLIFAFIGTGCSFLAFAIMAEKRKIKDMRFANKGIYYLNGLAEGTETIIFLILFCLLPQHFPILAWTFAVICYITTIVRVTSGYKTLL